MTSPYQSPTPLMPPTVAPPAGQAYVVPPKPVGPTIFGVLNLLIGLLGLLGIAGWVASMLLFRSGMGGNNPVYDQMFSSTVYAAFNIGSMVLGSIFTVVLLAAGVGMLAQKPWGRTLSIAYAVYTLMAGVVGAAVNYVYVFGPMMRQSTGGGPEAAGAMVGAVGGLIGTCAWMVYPLSLLVYCMLPSTKQIFARSADPAPRVAALPAED